MSDDLELKALVPDPKNARKHTPRNVGMIVDALHEVGAARSIVIDENNVILAGNATVEAAAEAGITKMRVVEADGNTVVAVRRRNLTPEQKSRLALFDNRTAELAEWDADVVRELKEMGLTDGLFTDDEIEDLTTVRVDPKDGLTDPDEVPPTRATTVKLGDVFRLGKHVVVCGDSTNPATVALAMQGQRADLCFTSPPYGLGENIKFRGEGASEPSTSAYVTHEDEGGQVWLDLMERWFIASEPHCDGWMVNLQMIAGNKREMIAWMHTHIDRLIDVAVWDKGHGAPAFTPGVLSGRHEWLILFGKEGASRVVPSASWRGTVQSIYEGPPNRSGEFAEIHGAVMPTHLPLWALGTVCDRAVRVYEPFAGVGTTIMACEQLDRACHAIEIDPVYVQVIIDRWERFTGQKAEPLHV